MIKKKGALRGFGVTNTILKTRQGCDWQRIDLYGAKTNGHFGIINDFISGMNKICQHLLVVKKIEKQDLKGTLL